MLDFFNLPYAADTHWPLWKQYVAQYSLKDVVMAILCHAALGIIVAGIATVAVIVVLRWAWKKHAAPEALVGLIEEGRSRDYFAQVICYTLVVATACGIGGNLIDLDHISARCGYRGGRFCHTWGFDVAAFFILTIYAKLAVFTLGCLCSNFFWRPIAHVGQGLVGAATAGWDVKDKNFLWRYTTYHAWRTALAWVVATHVLEDYYFNWF